MNYRHVFHAGNFADLAKHAVLTRLLRDLAAGSTALTVIDTHAGAGLYDLEGVESRRTGEGSAGVVRLMAASNAPEAFNDLKAAVKRANPPDVIRYYPGSPMIIAGALRPRDRYIACEMRADDYNALKQVLPREAGALAYRGDGWEHAGRVAPQAPARLLVLIDPPFERADDYANAIGLIRRLLRLNPGAVVALWAPIKDLATFDAALGEIEDATSGRPLLTVEVRLRPLSDPMRLNGCAMIIVNPTTGLEATAEAAAKWLAGHLGEAGALGRVMRLGGHEA